MFRASVRMRPDRPAASPCTSRAHSSSAPARLPLSTADTYLGRSGAPLADALPKLLAQKGLDGVSYLADISASDCVEHAGDEVFILIPRGDRVLSLYNYVLETNDNYDAYPGALL